MKEVLKEIRKMYIGYVEEGESCTPKDMESFMDRVIDFVENKLKEQASKTVQERVKEEREELKERLDKLNSFLDKVFIKGTVFISETQAHYLKEQREYMQRYLSILDKRLEDFARAEVKGE